MPTSRPVALTIRTRPWSACPKCSRSRTTTRSGWHRERRQRLICRCSFEETAWWYRVRRIAVKYKSVVSLGWERGRGWCWFSFVFLRGMGVMWQGKLPQRLIYSCSFEGTAWSNRVKHAKYRSGVSMGNRVTLWLNSIKTLSFCFISYCLI